MSANTRWVLASRRFTAGSAKADPETRRDDRNALGTWSPWSKQSRRSRANSAAIVRVRIRLSPPPTYLILQIFSPRRPGFEIPRHLRGFAAMPIRRAVGETAFKRL